MTPFLKSTVIAKRFFRTGTRYTRKIDPKNSPSTRALAGQGECSTLKCGHVVATVYLGAIENIDRAKQLIIRIR